MPGGFGKAGNLIQGLAALIALFPAAAVIFELVDIPPTLADLMRIITFSVSLIVLIAVFLLRARIQAMRNGVAAISGVVAVLLGAACLTAYFQFANAHTVVIVTPTPGGSDVTDRYIVPLNPSPAIQAQVDPYFGDYEEALRMSIERETLKQLMRQESASSVILMVLLLVISQVLLIAPVVAAAWKLVGGPDPGGQATD